MTISTRNLLKNMITGALSIVALFGTMTFGMCQVPVNTISKAPDITKVPTLYEVGYSHLDTEWCWMYPQVINEFIGNTLHQNFTLFDKYPDYVFNWTGANRYKFMKEYYPVEYAKLKTYVAQGKWVNTGSSLEEGDVNIPSEESIIRHVMYGNEFFNNEFHSSSSDFILPDCFGFPASLPSILAHCGLNGFSTQKLTWGSAERTMGSNGVPFNLGVWVGPDNQGVFAALNPQGYTTSIDSDLSNDNGWLTRLNGDGAQSDIFADYTYYGVGDRGGSVRDSDAANLERSIHGTGPVHVVSARSDQVFNDLDKVDTSKLPRYKGDLLLTWHSSGSATSQAEMKRWNHENEKIADATERASVAADWLGALPYDKARITDAWWKFLPGQFHDLMAGTALPMAYEYSWNDEVLALNEFAGELQEAVGGVSRALDTSGPGVPVVVYNPLSSPRQDVVEANIAVPGNPVSIQVVAPDGALLPSQVEGRTGSSFKLLFLATVPSIGYTAFLVKPAAAPSLTSELKVGKTFLENAHYKVTLNSDGDVSSIYDKKAGKELLASPLRLAFQYENPSQYPAWNMDWEDQSKAPEGYVDGPAKISVVENGPVRVGIQVERWARGSHFVEVVRLAAGQAGSRVEFVNHIDWQTKEAALMAVMPLTVSNPLATYNWELGTIKRSTDDPLKYEVPSHQWFDLTDNSGKYGVTVLSGDRYGSDKPTDSTLRLTLVYTPGVRAGFVHQATNDWGHHDLSFAITGHSGDWTPQSSQWPALRFDRPLIAFQAPSHRGALGKSFSFARTNNPSVSVEALKQAEASHQIVVRFNELAGKPEKNVEASFASAVISAKEVNGQETAIGPATVINGNLVFDMTAYRPRAFALTLAAPHVHLSAPSGTPVKLAYNVNVTKPFGSPLGGSFDSSGNAIPADMLPSSLVSDGIAFALAPADAAKNAVEARGQKITLQNHSADEKLYILAASSSGDKSTTFAVGGREEIRTIQAWNGKIGQWDDRVWGGIIPELTYDMTNPLIGLNPGYIKRDPVAWYSDHIRGGDGVNQAYNYCYVYRYALELPAGAASVTLPNQPDIKILAATISDDPNAEVVPAQNLYDTLQRPSSNQPQVATNPSADGGSTTVEIESPLYFQPNASIRYTVDGSKPTLQSAAYAAPLVLSQSAVVKAAYIKNDGTVLGIASASAAVANPSGPKVTGVSANSATTLTLSFSELLDRATASDPAHYTLSPTNAISSAALSASGTSVTLTLAAPRDDSQDGTITVSGVTSAVPGGLPVSNGNAVSIPRPHVIFERDQAVTYDGTNAFSQDVTGLPTSGSAPWTINLWAYFENTPGELTTLAGFGDDSDTTGAERYLLKYHDGIHFWGSNIDISTGILYDLSKWQMVTATFDGTSLRIYKDGALIKTAPITLTDAASTVKIGPNGPWDNASKINGKIARVRIWSAALSDAEINALFSSPPAN